MELPERLKTALFALEEDGAQLAADYRAISERYRTKNATGERIVRTEGEAAAYAVARMPATYGAVYQALKNATEALGVMEMDSLIDAGAGTGAASLAAVEWLGVEDITCYEREQCMQNVGKRLLPEAKWADADLAKGGIAARADLVIASYVLNEIAMDRQGDVALSLWNCAEKLLLIVEPGTPEGYENLMRVRDGLIRSGAHIVAPCPDGRACPMEKDDWCHFTCRVARSRMHKWMKGGDAPYEDEKYAYLAFARKDSDAAISRVLRHPVIRKGYVELTACTAQGISRVTVSKKDGETYKAARKAQAGDAILL